MGHPEGPGGPGSSASWLDLRRRDLTATRRRYVKKKPSIKSRARAMVCFIVSRRVCSSSQHLLLIYRNDTISIIAIVMG